MDVGNYTLLHVLGRGGTSEVYAAQHRERGDKVAVKLVQTSAGVDLAAEAMRVRDIHHPNVVRMLEVGNDATSCYLVMELVEGETLAARIRRGPLREVDVRELGAAIADGMQAAHARGIVHRDLKPGNVMLRGDDPVIVDFGIAKSLGATSAAVTERRVGTVAYMAPEQLVDGLITPAVDIWALGVTLYEAATGELPFKSFVDGRLPQLFEAAPRITTTSPAFADLISRCLDRDPGKRPASMAEIARALRSEDGDRVTADIGSTSVAPRSHDRAIDSKPRRLPRRWPVAVVGVAAIATTMFIVMRAPTSSPQTPTPPTSVVPVDAAVAMPPAVEAQQVPVPASPQPTTMTAPTVKTSPVVKTSPSPPKRTKARPKKRTTRQGETLD